MTALAVVITAVVSVATYLLAWWRGRQRRLDAEATWKRIADAQAARAEGAEAVVREQGAAALETQHALEKEIHDAATARLAHPDRSARLRVQERWQRTDPAGGDVQAGPSRTVHDGAADRSGPHPAPRADVRGKR